MGSRPDFEPHMCLDILREHILLSSMNIQTEVAIIQDSCSRIISILYFCPCILNRFWYRRTLVSVQDTRSTDMDYNWGKRILVFPLLWSFKILSPFFYNKDGWKWISSFLWLLHINSNGHTHILMVPLRLASWVMSLS